jgi:hypothetical protein
VSLGLPAKTPALIDSRTKDLEEPAFTIKGLEMLSRLGSDYYLGSSADKKIDVSVPKKYVLSWSYDEASSSASSKYPQPASTAKGTQPKGTTGVVSSNAVQSSPSIRAASPVVTPTPGKP